MTSTKTAKAELVGKYRQHEKDSGSPEVQIALLTDRIRVLTDHLEQHEKDHATRRGLLMLVSKRNTLLKYLSTRAPARYRTLIQSLGLRK
jgi:small subunit ribosomal protein S15